VAGISQGSTCIWAFLSSLGKIIFSATCYNKLEKILTFVKKKIQFSQMSEVDDLKSASQDKGR
jgi:hypothetical protein